MKRHITWIYFEIDIFSFGGLWRHLRNVWRLTLLEDGRNGQEFEKEGNDISHIFMSKISS